MRKEDIVLARAERLASALRPADSPTVCPNCLAAFVYGRSAEDGSTSLQPNIILLQYRCPKFWDAAMAFLMCERTPEDAMDLHRQLAVIRSQCVRCARDRAWGCCDCDYVRHVLDSCCTALYICLCKSPSRKELIYRGTFKRWPETTSQLMPLGPRLAARAMINLLGFIVYAHHLLSEMISRERAAMMIAISDDANRHALLCSVLDSLDRLTGNLDIQPMRPSNAMEALVAQREDISYLLLTVCMPAAEEARLDVTYLRGYHRALSHALNAFICRGNEWGLWRGRIVQIAYMLWQTLPPHVKGPRPAYAEEERCSAVDLERYLELHRILSKSQRRSGCCYAECTRAAHPRELRTCARCQYTRYCSRECQRADWKGPEQHRDICDMLHELSVVASLDLPADEFAEACRRHEFPLARAGRLVDWACGGPNSYGLAAPAVRTGEGGYFTIDVTSWHGLCEH